MARANSLWCTVCKSPWPERCKVRERLEDSHIRSLTIIGLYSVHTAHTLERAYQIHVHTHEYGRSTPGLAEAASVPSPGSHGTLTNALHRRSFATAPPQMRTRPIGMFQWQQPQRQSTAHTAEQGPGGLRA